MKEDVKEDVEGKEERRKGGEEERRVSVWLLLLTVRTGGSRGRSRASCRRCWTRAP